ncbi:hypothetical protein A6U96_14030 [Agrobacterium tumefaciens]|nr:hypothetical protein A6U96_14030 [Agrobacterium tumefaciens]
MENIANDVNNLIQSDNNTGATDDYTPIQGDDAAMNSILSILDSNDGTTNIGNETEQVTEAETNDVTTGEQPESDSEVETEVEEGTNDEKNTYELPSDDTVINVNGQELSFGELKNGYMRRNDYTIKTQEASAIRKEAEKAIAEATRIVETNVLSDIRKQFEVEYNFHRPTAEQWADWQANDPFRFTEEMAKWQQRDAQVKQLMEYDAQTKAMTEARAKEEHEANVAEAHAQFTSEFPEFLDATKRGPLVKDMVSTLEDIGFNHEEISNISDARHMKIVYLASQALKAQKANTVSKQILATKPVTNKPNNVQKSNIKKPSPQSFGTKSKVLDDATIISQLAARL